MGIKAFTRKVSTKMNANADILMTVGALIGLGTTIYLTARQMPEILEALDSYKADMTDLVARRDNGDLDPAAYEAELKDMRFHYFKIFMKLSAPAIASAIITGGLIIGSTTAGRAKQALLSSALNTSNLALSSYKDYMRKELGEKKYAEVDSAYEMDRVKTIPEVQMPLEIINTGKGDKLYSVDVIPWDPSTRVFFRSSPEKVKEGFVDLKSWVLDMEMDQVLYADYLYYVIGNEVLRDKKTFAGAYHLIFEKDDRKDWPKPIYKEFVHDKLNENWCHIAFREDDWDFIS